MGCDDAFGTETAPLCECQPAEVKVIEGIACCRGSAV